MIDFFLGFCRASIPLGSSIRYGGGGCLNKPALSIPLVCTDTMEKIFKRIKYWTLNNIGKILYMVIKYYIPVMWLFTGPSK